MDNSVIADLRRELQQTKQDLKEARASLALWEENGILLTDIEKQFFYQRYRNVWREKRAKEQAEAEEELKKLAAYFEDCRTYGGKRHEKRV